MLTLLQTSTYSDWFNGLHDRMVQIRITARLKRVEMGHLGDAKSVGGDVSELRLAFGPGYRLYFTRRGSEVILLLCGGDKSSQARDIKRAQSLALQLQKE